MREVTNPEARQETLDGAPMQVRGQSPEALAATLAAGEGPQVSGQLPKLARETSLPRVRREGGKLALHEEGRARYEPVRALGAGGMGEVVLVQDNDIERRVAMKKLKDPEQESGLVRFLDEIKTVGRLEHPNIVPLYDAGKDEQGSYFFVMKYVEGDDLRTILRRLDEGNKEYHQKYSFSERLRIFVEVLHAIHYAHARGIIHRDLKPENIMVGAFGEVRVMDWGVAKVIGGELEVNRPKKGLEGLLADLRHRAPEADLRETLPERLSETSDGALIGSPAYMSPEQALGEAADARSDVYALCALFYEFLTLRHCFPDKKNLNAMLMATLEEEPPLAGYLKHPHQGNVPLELSWFLHKGLRKKPEDRYQSVEEMIHALHMIDEGHCPVQCPTTMMKRMGGELNRRFNDHPILTPGMFGAVVLLILGLAGVGAWSLLF